MPRLIDLARQAKAHDLNFTVDAEEADRLELSLDVIAAALRRSIARRLGRIWAGDPGLSEARSDVIDYVDRLARSLNRRMMVRLVKGAYWDTEIKRAQERGLDGYPVFTRKAMTDLNYVACAQQLLALRPRIFPQFATHNALTVATLLELAKGRRSGFEFQRLHGMGEALYAQLGEDRPDIACRTYAPVGSHRDLLAYLVRRLLENGANSSFVALAADEAVPVSQLLRRPADIIGSADNAGHPNIPLPRDLYRPQRKNSRGLEFGERAALNQLVAAVARGTMPAAGSIADATAAEANAAISAARDGFKTWSRRRPRTRAAALEKAADLLEQRAAHFIALLQREGGKTLDDALSEVREAVDFCRYYAAEGREQFGDGKAMPGPTGESNCSPARPRRLRRDLAVEFSAGDLSGPGHGGADGGQCRRRKTRRTDAADRREAVRLLHEAGVPTSALHLVQATAGSAPRWWRIPISPASSSPARPRSRDRSTARWPPRTARSCR